jgi:hypothetical protein
MVLTFMLMVAKVAAGPVGGEGGEAWPVVTGPWSGFKQLCRPPPSPDSEERNDSGSGRLTYKSSLADKAGE